MPFKSRAQRAYLFATNPKVAREFAAATPKGAKLPEHVARAGYNKAMSDKLRKKRGA